MIMLLGWQISWVLPAFSL
uniref:Uncharacterized protein n=1 Tax=Anguilla anguilla TaxID=7936 RepID=A0A0E9TRN0_ANGAN